MTRGVVQIRRGALAFAAAIAVGGCSGPAHSHVSSAVTGHFKGLAKGVTVPGGKQGAGSQNPWAAWAGQDSIYVMTWGSGSCPRIPSSVKAADAGHVVISTAEHDFYNGSACTADLAVTTSIVRLPSGVDATHAIVVQIDGTSTDLAARAG